MQQGNHEPLDRFGCRLRRLREQAGLSQRDVAIAVGVTAHMVHRWERRGAIPAAARLPELAAVLGAPLDALLGRPAHDNGVQDAGTEAPRPASPRTLRELREAAGLSQWQLAVRLGVTDGAISRWEAGDRQPRARYLGELARLVGGGSVATVLDSLTTPPKP